MKFNSLLFKILLAFLRVHGLQAFVFCLGRCKPFFLLFDRILLASNIFGVFIRIVLTIVIPWDVPSLRAWFVETHVIKRVQPCCVLLRSRITRSGSRSKRYERVWGGSSSRSPNGTGWIFVNRCAENRVGRRGGVTLEGLVYVLKRWP